LNFQIPIITTQVIITLAILVYASWSDYKTREVSNRVWMIYAPIALALSLLELLLYQSSQIPLYILGFGLTAGIAFLLFYAGGFGGADSNALPFAPLELFAPIIPGAISPTSQILFSITIFGNAVLFAAASGIYMLIRNIVWHKKTKTKMFSGTLKSESLGKKFLVLITGYKMKVSKVKEKWHIFPLEDIEEGELNLKRKLVIMPHDENRIKIVERLSKAVEDDKIDGFIWATPGLPMLIFVTLGLVIALSLGDFVWLLVKLLLGA
jgi:preflagellin peptidase FlaK